MKHVHETWAFLVKSGILWTSVYNVYGSQNEFVKRVTRVFILRKCSLGQNGPPAMEYRICGSENSLFVKVKEVNWMNFDEWNNNLTRDIEINGANAVSYPCRYLSFHSTNLHQNDRKYFKNLFPITHVNLNQIRYREALNSTSTWMSSLKTVRGRVSYCLERWHPSRRRIQRFPISELVQIYVSDWKQVLKYVPLFWCRLVLRKLSRRVSYCKERRSRRRIQCFPIFDLVQIYVSDWK